MSHKNNKNSKDNKKSRQKTHKEVKKMQEETANEIGFSKQSRKLGKNESRIDSSIENRAPRTPIREK